VLVFHVSTLIFIHALRALSTRIHVSQVFWSFTTHAQICSGVTDDRCSSSSTQMYAFN